MFPHLPNNIEKHYRVGGRDKNRGRKKKYEEEERERREKAVLYLIQFAVRATPPFVMTL
jgi:hypothetical protein